MNTAENLLRLQDTATQTRLAYLTRLLTNRQALLDQTRNLARAALDAGCEEQRVIHGMHLVLAPPISSPLRSRNTKPK